MAKESNTVHVSNLKPADLQRLSTSQIDLVLRTVDLANASTLNMFTNRLATFIESEASQDVYEDAIKQAIKKVMDRFKSKLPRWLRFFKGKIASVVAEFLTENLSKMIVSFLRRLGRSSAA